MEFLVTYWIEFLFGILISLTAYLYKKIIEYHKMMNATKNGVQVLLKSKIIEKYSEYKRSGFISLYDRETINELYTEYKLLGGNGLVGKLIDDIEEISIGDYKCSSGGEKNG